MSTHLRVIWPDDVGSEESARVPTLTEFYETYVLPCIRSPRDRSPATIEQDRVALRHWARITGDPPINKITQRTCALFMDALSDRSPATRRKIAIHLQFILDQAGPPDRRHRSAAGLLTVVPYLERPESYPHEPKRAYTFQELEALIDATQRVTRSKAISLPNQALWWASLIRFAWHSALRRMNILNACWSWIKPDGWLEIPASSYKQQKAERRFYLSTAARSAITRIRTREGRVFAWNGHISNFRTKWNQLTRVLPPSRRFGLKAIRRAALTWLAERNPLVARLVAGHRKLDVLEDFYVQREVVIALLEQMPSPQGWDLE